MIVSLISFARFACSSGLEVIEVGDTGGAFVFGIEEGDVVD